MNNFSLPPRAKGLVLAAFAGSGPLSRKVWATRAGIPLQHMAVAMQYLVRKRAVVVQEVGDLVRILPQPFSLWRGPVRPRAMFLAAWQRQHVPEQDQHIFDLATEAPGMAEALASDAARIVVLPKAEIREDLEQLQADLAHIRHLPPAGVSPQIGECAPQIGEQSVSPQIGEQGKFPAPQFGERTEKMPGEADLLAPGSDPKMRGTEGPSPCPAQPSGGGEMMEQTVPAQAIAQGRSGKQRVALPPLQPDAAGPPKLGRAGRLPNLGSPPQIGELGKNAGENFGGRAAAGRAASPPSPTPPPPQERLNVERLTFNVPAVPALPKSGSEETVQRSTFQRSKEAELMKRIAAHVGPEDMAGFGAAWRMCCVRKIPAQVIEAALADREARRREGFTPDVSWGADLWYTVKLFNVWQQAGKLNQ